MTYFRLLLGHANLGKRHQIATEEHAERELVAARERADAQQQDREAGYPELVRRFMLYKVAPVVQERDYRTSNQLLGVERHDTVSEKDAIIGAIKKAMEDSGCEICNVVTEEDRDNREHPCKTTIEFRFNDKFPAPRDLESCCNNCCIV